MNILHKYVHINAFRWYTQNQPVNTNKTNHTFTWHTFLQNSKITSSPSGIIIFNDIHPDMNNTNNRSLWIDYITAHQQQEQIPSPQLWFKQKWSTIFILKHQLTSNLFCETRNHSHQIHNLHQDHLQQPHSFPSCAIFSNTKKTIMKQKQNRI